MGSGINPASLAPVVAAFLNGLLMWRTISRTVDEAIGTIAVRP